ncbi:hypothetical protein TNIN_451351 [Trichonephila inaurata madagascariensis]|uniref:Uncharacterized protein n=1 Tax=Trichonephila inaurata madagascariensis TaxID=2747483 RepID=A0A8X6YVH3_9ARAC|nr:hypothetical protein TNIN_451351 [Trichonephila inaurata madagascariensis]
MAAIAFAGLETNLWSIGGGLTLFSVYHPLPRLGYEASWGGGIDFARRWLALLHKTLANGVFEKPSSPVETRYPSTNPTYQFVFSRNSRERNFGHVIDRWDMH